MILNQIKKLQPFKIYGQVRSINGLMIKAKINTSLVKIGSQCLIEQEDGSTGLAQVIAFDGEDISIMAFEPLNGVRVGSYVCLDSKIQTISPSIHWKGRVLNALCDPIDEKGPLIIGETEYPLDKTPPKSHQRGRVKDRLDVGIRSINTFLTCCKGQRLGIFAGSGVGKSMLLSMLARFTKCDVCVIGLIGERGREVREFIEDILGEEGLLKSIIVVATSDEPALMRSQAAQTTMSICEYFCDLGMAVLCVMDSITRFAMARREIGLSLSEPATTKGYTPSVFFEMSKILERAGPGKCCPDSNAFGTITGFFTVLVDGDDHNEPIADAVRGTLDGHFVLDRKLSEKGHYPPIQVLKSISRMVPNCQSEDEQNIVKYAKKILSTYNEMEDFIKLGAYKEGTSQEIDLSIKLFPKIMQFLEQNHKEKDNLEESFKKLEESICFEKE